ncbi:MAG: hypothetical protein R3B72_38010 [Polyangiaceae bacterium]
MKVTPSLVVAGLVGVVALAGFGYATFQTKFGKGKVYVIAPKGTTVDVAIDGAKVGQAQEGKLQPFDVAQGAHEVELTVEGRPSHKRTIDVENGTYSEVVTAHDQCLALLDVYATYYLGQPVVPRVVGVATAERSLPVKVPLSIESGHVLALAEDQLPDEIPQGATVHLLLPVDCAAAAGDQAQMLASLGYTPESVAGKAAQPAPN